MSISDVAKRAGVSEATVSRVINKRPSVTTENVRRVRVAMDELGYVPRPNRPGPKPRHHHQPGIKTGNIGLVVLGRTLDLLREPLFARTLHALGTVVREHGLHLILDEIPSPGQLCASIRDHKVDGAIVLPGQPISEDAIEVLSRCVPLVHVFGEKHWLGQVDHVTADNGAVGGLAFAYLHEQRLASYSFMNLKGHFHPALVNRGRAFHDAARMAGVPTHGYSVTDTGCTTAAQAMDRFAAEAARPAGLFLAVDDQLEETYALLRRHGLEPGRDVAVIGAGNVATYLDRVSPRPATIELGVADIARHAVELLLRRIAEPHRPAVRLQAPPRLIAAAAPWPLNEALNPYAALQIRPQKEALP
ncbi:LacI family DNA-binding transcriptional regulator [bacterium]|nr:LacI family DNA-binding transcriptional regulator [bacterium]